MARNWLDQFVKDGTVSKDQLGEAEDMASSMGITPEDALMKLGYVDEGRIGQAKAKAFGFTFINLEEVELEHNVV